MAKKKKIKHWSKRKIDKKLYYGSILITILFCALVAFTYSIPSIGIPLESNIELNFQNLQNLFLTWASTPPKTHMTVETIKIPTLIYDLLDHTTTPGMPRITNQL
jgi:hypothetical protein